MPSALTFHCPSCKARIKVALKLLGQLRPCPRCKKSLRVRIQSPEDSPPRIIGDATEEQTPATPVR